MPSRERGRTPAAFRDQLLQRLRNEALRDGIPAQRVQQRVALERLLARLPAGGEWVLKGGLALLFRYGLRSRATRDVDLRTVDDVVLAVDLFRQAVSGARIDDNFTFEFGELAQEMQGAPGGSRRLRVVTRVAGAEFSTFHVDISSGDALVEAPDVLQGSDILHFAGIAPVAFPVYPVTQHLAEKLHAYTLPRAQENTRVKDLADLVIMAMSESVQFARLATSVDATFRARSTHALPGRLPEPPASWARPFAVIAADVPVLQGADLRLGHEVAAHFWGPFLSGSVPGDVWNPTARTWR